MSIISDTTENRDPIARKHAHIAAYEPITPGSPKHQELLAELREREVSDPLYASLIASAETQTDPSILGYLYGSTLAGRSGNDFPDVTGPAWADRHDDLGVNNTDNNPARVWLRTVCAEKFFSAAIEREDTYIPEEDRVVEGDTILRVGIDRNDSIEFLTPEHAREAAQKLLAAADAFEAVH